jgi:hypothetical protein
MLHVLEQHIHTLVIYFQLPIYTTALSFTSIFQIKQLLSHLFQGPISKVLEYTKSWRSVNWVAPQPGTSAINPLSHISIHSPLKSHSEEKQI